MAEEPSHKAMLYFVEVLMNTNGALTISQLAGRFGSRSFTPEMRTAAGSNEVGLKKFLLKYPSLFTVSGNMVSLFDSSKAAPASSEGSAAGDGSDDGAPPPARALPDVSDEMEASQYFQYKLMKKEERWVPIRSLAGHLSQASQNVRNVVGPQLDFRKWLLRHPHIFEVQGDLVGLRDGVAAVATPTIPRRAFAMAAANGDLSLSSMATSMPRVPPKTPPPQRRVPPKTPPTIRRSHSFSEKRAQQLGEPMSPIPHPRPLSQEIASAVSAMPTTPGARRRNAPVTMTANEYKAVMFLKDIVEKRGGIKIHNITGHFSQAAEGVRNTIGWTKMELEEFLRKNANVFNVSEDEVVTVNKNAKLNVIITGSRPAGSAIRTLTGRKGKVFHVAKLWGIIDLGKHEHVFFDKSIMRRPMDDLSKEFHVGEMLCFNAVLAPKTSRAKWRATHVWKEHEQQPSAADTEIGFLDSAENPLSPATSIEEEINRFLPYRDSGGSGSSSKYGDAAPSAAGVVPVWGTQHAPGGGGLGGGDGGDSMSNSSGAEDDRENVSMITESSFMTTSIVDDLRLMPNYHSIALPNGEKVTGIATTITAAASSISSSATNGVKDSEMAVGAAGDAKDVTSPRITSPTLSPRAGPTSSPGKKNTREMACQTISTGEIIATQLYQE